MERIINLAKDLKKLGTKEVTIELDSLEEYWDVQKEIDDYMNETGFAIALAEEGNWPPYNTNINAIRFMIYGVKMNFIYGLATT